jgi:hypothetical protein
VLRKGRNFFGIDERLRIDGVACTRGYATTSKPVCLFNNSGLKLFEIDFSSERAPEAIVATDDFPIVMTKLSNHPHGDREGI